VSSPEVTVIVPAFNAEDYIAECLRSIQNQSFRDFVCKVYDDGSTDRTREIVESFQRADSRFIVIHGDNIGTPRRVAGAYRDVSSEFFCQVDADDYIATDAIEILTKTLRGCHKNVGVVYSDYQKINSDGTPDYNDPYFVSRCRQPFSLKLAQERGLCAFQMRLIRTEAYRVSLGVNPGFPTGEDFDLVLKLAERCQFIHIPATLYYYRQHDKQTSRKNPSHLEMVCRKMMDESIKRKSKPDFALVLPHSGGDDIYAIRQWVQQVTDKEVLIAIVSDDPDDVDLQECKRFSQHRVEIIKKKPEIADYSDVVCRMVRGVPTVELTESLVPLSGAIDDLMSGRSVGISTLSSRISWLLRSGYVQFEMLRELAASDTEIIGDGPPGNSVLFRMTRENTRGPQ
jgi:glycosyltransferase involved in cell wall biosynthesis